MWACRPEAMKGSTKSSIVAGAMRSRVSTTAPVTDTPGPFGPSPGCAPARYAPAPPRGAAVLILQRPHHGNRFELVMQARHAHIAGSGEVLDLEGPIELTNAASRGGLLARAHVARPYQISRSLGDGDYRSVVVASNDRREDECVDHSETLESEDPEQRVHDAANPARARRVIKGLRVAFDKGPDIRVAAGCRHQMRAPADLGKGGPLRNVHCELDATDHAAPIFFGGQIVVEDAWLAIGPRAPQLDGSAAGRLQHQRPQDVGVVEGLRQA